MAKAEFWRNDFPPSPAHTPNSRLPAALIPTTHVRALIIGEVGVGKSTLFRRCRSMLLNVGRKAPDSQPSESSAPADHKTCFESLHFAIIPPEDQNDHGQELVFVELRDPVGVKASASTLILAQHDGTFERLEKIFADVNMIIVMLDLTRRESLQNSMLWMDIAKSHSNPAIGRTAIFVGNKRDLHRSISEAQGLQLASRYHATYMEMNSLTHDDDIDDLLVRIAKSALRLQRYQENMSMVGRQACPRDCTEGDSGRPHRHLFLANSLDWRIEYIDVLNASSSVWMPNSPVVDGNKTVQPIQQPYPAVHRSWLRIILQTPPVPRRENVERDDNSFAALFPRAASSDPRANRLVREFAGENPRAMSPPRLRVATNTFSRPDETFDERTSMLTWYPGAPMCFMSMWVFGILGCFRGNEADTH